MKRRKEKPLTERECEAFLVEILQKYYRHTVAMNVKSSLEVKAILKEAVQEMGATFLEDWEEMELTMTFYYSNGSQWFRAQLGILGDPQ